MKTIYTTLPIYDKLVKQCFERGKHASNNGLFEIVCPRHRLPSFQWKDESDGAASVSKIELVDKDGVTSIIGNLFDHLQNGTYGTFVSSDLDITNAIKLANNSGYGSFHNGALSEYKNAIAGDIITIKGNLHIIAGNAPYVVFFENGTELHSDLLAEGVNTINYTITETAAYDDHFAVSIRSNMAANIDNFSFTNVTITSNVDTFLGMVTLAHDYFTYSGTTLLSPLDPGIYYLKITMNNAKVYYSEWFRVDCVFGTDEGLPPTVTYSTKYLIINFHNDCDLGDIYYHGGFTQTIWLESEAMEMTFPMEEKGIENGEGQFIRSFARQDKKYTVRTKELPDYMVDVFNRMKLHDTIELIDLVGDSHTVYNLEVDHEWLGEDKYYAKIELKFDYNEAVVIGGCCNNIS